MIGRVFDIDDIILNVIGGLIGYLIYTLINSIGDRLPKIFRSNWFLNLISILLLGAFILYIWVVMVR
jgi:glycopeptide antibiotics resistance protein